MGENPMMITAERVGDVSVVVLKDQTLDARNYNDFKAAIEPVLADNPRVILDVSRLTFVDSSGLGAILSCRRKVKAADGDLKLLCGLSKPVRMFLELARVHQIIDIFNTQEEAVAAFGPL
jgi:anti-sigma B factor antagonist